MYLTDVMASLRRRWVWLVLALVVTTAATAYAASAIPTHYQLTASVVLVPPPATDDPKSNRYLSLGSLSQAASVLIRSLNSDQTHEAAAKIEPDGKFEAAADPATSAPVVVVTVDSTSRRVAANLLDAVMAQVPVNLARLQSSIDTPQTSRIESVPVTHDDKVTLVVKKKVRGAVATGLGVLVVGLVAIAALDGLLRREAEQEESADPVAIRGRRGGSGRRTGSSRSGRRATQLVSADRSSGRASGRSGVKAKR